MNVLLWNSSRRPAAHMNKEDMAGFGAGIAPRVAWPMGAFFFTRTAVRRPLPLMLASVAAVLRQQGHEVLVASDGRVRRADVVLIPSSVVDYHGERRAAEDLRRATGAHVGFIGPLASVRPDLYRSVADFVIRGEPEAAVLQWAQAGIPRGEVLSDPIQELDQLPFPAWDAFPVRAASLYPLLTERPVIPVLTSRGCTFGCDYCPVRVVPGRWRRRSVGHVLEELSEAVARLHIRGVEFRDPVFTLESQRAAALAEGLLTRGLDLAWMCETRADLLDRPLLHLLRRAGLRAIRLGIETAFDDTQASHDRTAISMEQQEAVVAYCDELDIQVAASYLVGLPGDDAERIQLTVDYAKLLNTMIADFRIPTPFPGTPFYERVRSRLVTEEWEQYTSYRPVYAHPNLSAARWQTARDRAASGYYGRWAYLGRHGWGLAHRWLACRVLDRVFPRVRGGPVVVEPTEVPDLEEDVVESA